MRLQVDAGWVRITEETNTDGEAIKPIYARNVRTHGGMIIGRIAHPDAAKFEAQVWRGGQFTLLGSFATFEEARHAIEVER